MELEEFSFHFIYDDMLFFFCDICLTSLFLLIVCEKQNFITLS